MQSQLDSLELKLVEAQEAARLAQAAEARAGAAPATPASAGSSPAAAASRGAATALLSGNVSDGNRTTGPAGLQAAALQPPWGLATLHVVSRASWHQRCQSPLQLSAMGT